MVGDRTNDKKSFNHSAGEQETNLLPLFKRDFSSRLQKLLQQISLLAGREKVKVFLVGGTIRDLLLKYPPAEDLDLVVIGDAVAFAHNLQKLLGGKIRAFEQFGTASLHLKEGLRLDLATARKEYYASPAALPRVESSSLKNDLFRRDFTINTMACSLAAESYGQLYDYFNGRRDLSVKLIRVLYRLSFVDDPLRILRAIRFEQRYGFTVEPETLSLLKKAGERRVLKKVSRQRLNRELKLIYKEPSPLKILKRFDQLELMPFLYPRASLNRDVRQLLDGLEEILKWAEERNWDQKPDRELLYLSGLLLGLESVDRSAIIRKLNLSRERATVILTACREAPKIIENLDRAELNHSKIVSYLEPHPVEALLLAHALAERRKTGEYIKLYLDGLRFTKPGVKGSDLKKLGLEPGPHYQKVINLLRKAILDGEVTTPQEELDFVIKYLKTKKGREE